MATKQQQHADSIEALLCVNVGGFRGYSQNILIQNLSKLERKFLICCRCQGLSRQAVVFEGKTMCESCTDTGTSVPNEEARDSINEIEVICPLNDRSCDWKGQLGELEQHLLQCNQLLIVCQLNCQSVIARYQIPEHETNFCQMRRIACDFCKETILAKNMNGHLIICPAFPVDCPEGCTMKLRRDSVIGHVSTLCELKKVPCPYHDFGCTASSMARKEIQTHQEEQVIPHQLGLFLQIGKQSKRIEALNVETIAQREQINKQSEEIGKQVKQISNQSGDIGNLYKQVGAQTERINEHCETNQLLNTEVRELKNVITEQNVQITKLANLLEKQVVESKSVADKLNSQNSKLQTLVEQNSKVLHIASRDRGQMSLSGYVDMIKSDKNLTLKDFQFIEHFEWELADFNKLMLNIESVELPPFQLVSSYKVQCRTDFRSQHLYINIQKVPGGFTSSQELRICYYCIQLVNKEDNSVLLIQKNKSDCVISGGYSTICSFPKPELTTVFANTNAAILRIQLIPTTF